MNDFPDRAANPVESPVTPSTDKVRFSIAVTGNCHPSTVPAVRAVVEKALITLEKFGVEVASISTWSGTDEQLKNLLRAPEGNTPALVVHQQPYDTGGPST